MNTSYKTIPFVLTLIACICVGCGTTNTKYTIASEIGAPAGPDIVDKNTPTIIIYTNLTINDVVGNELERKLLQEAGLLTKTNSTTTKGKPIAFEGDQFSEEFRNSLKNAAKEQAAQMPAAKPGQEISFDDIVSKALSKVSDQLKATYIISNKLTLQSFEFDKPDKVIQSQFKFDQTTLGYPITSSPPAWKALLFRGDGFDIATLDVSLNRKSLISDQLQSEIEKLQKSTFMADTLSSILGSIPALGGAGSQVGKYFGAQLDKAIYNTVNNNYAPKFAIANANFPFMTSETIKREGGNSVTLNPTVPDQTFYLGNRELIITAKTQNQGNPVKVLTVTLDASDIFK